LAPTNPGSFALSWILKFTPLTSRIGSPYAPTYV
jgi:hypothetical protein